MKKLKYLKLLAISLFLSTVYSTPSFAVDTEKIRNYFKNPSDKLPNTGDMTRTIFSILTTIGYALAVIVLLVTAVGFIIGSPQKRAQLKEKLWLILIGVIILAGGIPILQLIANIMEQAGSTL